MDLLWQNCEDLYEERHRGDVTVVPEMGRRHSDRGGGGRRWGGGDVKHLPGRDQEPFSVLTFL